MTTVQCTWTEPPSMDATAGRQCFRPSGHAGPHRVRDDGPMVAPLVEWPPATREFLEDLFPPQHSATGWKLLRQTLGDRVSNTRTRLALTIAPWLEIR